MLRLNDWIFEKLPIKRLRKKSFNIISDLTKVLAKEKVDLDIELEEVKFISNRLSWYKFFKFDLIGELEVKLLVWNEFVDVTFWLLFSKEGNWKSRWDDFVMYLLSPFGNFVDIDKLFVSIKTYLDLYQIYKIFVPWKAVSFYDFINRLKLIFVDKFDVETEEEFMKMTINDNIKQDLKKVFQRDLLNIGVNKGRYWYYVPYVFEFLKNELGSFIWDLYKLAAKRLKENTQVNILFADKINTSKEIGNLRDSLYLQPNVGYFWDKIKSRKYGEIVNNLDKNLFIDKRIKNIFEQKQVIVDIWWWFIDRVDVLWWVFNNEGELILVDSSYFMLSRLLNKEAKILSVKGLVENYFNLEKKDISWDDKLWLFLGYTFGNLTLNEQIEFIKKWFKLKNEKDKLVIQVFTTDNLKRVDQMYNNKENEQFVLWAFENLGIDISKLKYKVFIDRNIVRLWAEALDKVVVFWKEYRKWDFIEVISSQRFSDEDIYNLMKQLDIKDFHYFKESKYWGAVLII